MLECTFEELLKPNKVPNFFTKSVIPEKDVVLEKSEHAKHGRFDFFAQAQDGRLIGVEVLTRPSKGKLVKKLVYANAVDHFIFVLPTWSLGLYRKIKKNGIKFSVRKKFLPKELGSRKIFVWLFEPKTKKFLSKSIFSKEFNVGQ